MEKIQKFENCKIENMQTVYGGKYVVQTDYAPAGHPEATDKFVYNNCDQVVKFVSNTHTLFHKDKHKYPDNC
jgi:hypothetical protein